MVLDFCKCFVDKTVSMFLLVVGCFSGNWGLVKIVHLVRANILESMKLMSGKVLHVAIVHVSSKTYF